ncbi:MAG: hypothetical protein OXF42_05275 [Candidatus Dadabacteria bacterium]|nr:hypothetical protein [Candidatus Dadabacteria bacterium]
MEGSQEVMADEKKKIHESDLLRTKDNVIKHDSRWEHFSYIEGSVLNRGPLPLERYRESIVSISLLDSVPYAIRVQFETVKNLALYSWFVYRFVPIAELIALVTVENTLKEYFGKKGWGLKKLLKEAKKQNLIQKEGFAQFHRAKEYHKEVEKMSGMEDMSFSEPEDYVSILIETLPNLRNDLAHGDIGLYPDCFLTVRSCAEIINQVYDNKPD